MGKLLQVLGARLEQIRNELNEPEPEEVGKDPKKAVEYIKRKIDAGKLNEAYGKLNKSVSFRNFLSKTPAPRRTTRRRTGRISRRCRA